MRQQIGTVRITRTRIYQLDPLIPERFGGSTVVVDPGEYPVYADGMTRYWRMTGHLNTDFTRLGDGMFAFTMNGADAPGDDDVMFYSKRYGPDEWADLMAEFDRAKDPRLVFTLDADAPGG